MSNHLLFYVLPTNHFIVCTKVSAFLTMLNGSLFVCTCAQQITSLYVPNQPLSVMCTTNHLFVYAQPITFLYVSNQSLSCMCQPITFFYMPAQPIAFMYVPNQHMIIIMCRTNSFGPINIPYPDPYQSFSWMCPTDYFIVGPMCSTNHFLVCIQLITFLYVSNQSLSCMSLTNHFLVYIPNQSLSCACPTNHFFYFFTFVSYQVGGFITNTEWYVIYITKVLYKT